MINSRYHNLPFQFQTTSRDEKDYKFIPADEKNKPVAKSSAGGNISWRKKFQIDVRSVEFLHQKDN
jgi:hypothetical protein